MKTAAAIATIIAAIILLPFAGVMLTGAPPPGARGAGAPGASNCGKTAATTTVSGATTQGSGKLPANWKAIANFLTGHGYSKNAAAGIDGNVEAESGGNPEQLEIGGGGGTGIIQWTPASSAAPVQPIVTGNVSADLAAQLTDLLTYNDGIGQTAIAALNAEPTAAQAAAYYESQFEKPLSLADAGTRGDNATAVLTALTNGTGGGGVTTVSTSTPCPAAKTSTTGSIAPMATGKAAVAIAYAKAQLGKPYVWGGTGPDGYDCSGLVMMAWRAAGVNIPRTSQAQWAGLQHITAAQAQPGDLIFYAGADGTLSSPGHVVMDLGGGSVIQAYATGTPIEISTLASMTSSGLVGYARP